MCQFASRVNAKPSSARNARDPVWGAKVWKVLRTLAAFALGARFA